jgi:hypothetical protein
MATSQQFLVCDSSTLANFKQWAQAISAFFTTATWTQSTDTGQVNWSTISSVPGSGAYVYEVWQPNDGLTNFYVKVEYGNISGTNSPGLRLTISTSTNGAGTATGFVLGPYTPGAAITPPSTSVTYECNFSGAAGRIGIMMWRNAPGAINTCPAQFFAIERSINSSGSYTGSYVTLWNCGPNPGSVSSRQQSLYFSVGVTQLFANRNDSSSTTPGMVVRSAIANLAGSSAFNGSIPFDTATPCVGFFDYPCTVVGLANALDIAEGVTFTATLYGSTRTYMPSKVPTFSFATVMTGVPTMANALCMRFD